MDTPATRRDRIAVAALVLAHAAMSWRGYDPARTPPFSGRYAWSMFAGPLSGRCAHTLVRVDPAGREHAPPLPPPGTALHAVLAAETPDAFATIAPRVLAYADSDARLADAPRRPAHPLVARPPPPRAPTRCTAPCAARARSRPPSRDAAS
jgi:hypothetical protein